MLKVRYHRRDLSALSPRNDSNLSRQHEDVTAAHIVAFFVKLNSKYSLYIASKATNHDVHATDYVWKGQRDESTSKTQTKFYIFLLTSLSLLYRCLFFATTKKRRKRDRWKRFSTFELEIDLDSTLKNKCMKRETSHTKMIPLIMHIQEKSNSSSTKDDFSYLSITENNELKSRSLLEIGKKRFEAADIWWKEQISIFLALRCLRYQRKRIDIWWKTTKRGVIFPLSIPVIIFSEEIFEIFLRIFFYRRNK